MDDLTWRRYRSARIRLHIHSCEQKLRKVDEEIKQLSIESRNLNAMIEAYKSELSFNDQELRRLDAVETAMGDVRQYGSTDEG